jgi:hypothetical protein
MACSGNASRVLRPDGGFDTWGGFLNLPDYPPALKVKGLYFSQAVIRVKEHPVLTRKDSMTNHELAFYGWKEGAAPPLLRATERARCVAGQEGLICIRLALRRGLFATDGDGAIDAAVERGDDPDPGPLRARDEVGIREVEAQEVVDLDGALQEVPIDDPDGREGQHRSQRGRHLRPRRLVERLEDVGDLGQDEVGEQQLVGGTQVSRGALGLLGWVSGQMGDDDVGIDEGGHRRAAARARRVCRRTSSQGVPRFAAGTLTDPASARRSGVRARGVGRT